MHTQRLFGRFVVVCAVLFFGVLNAPTAELAPMRLAAGASTTVAITAAERNNELQNVLRTLNLSAADRTAALNDFVRMPVEAQDVAMARLNPAYATKIGSAAARDQYKVPAHIDPALLTTPGITGFFPASAGVGSWVEVDGVLFTPDCVVKFDGTEELPTYYSLGMLLFKVPTRPVGTVCNVTVLNKKVAHESAPSKFKVVAPRGYRGISGWQFVNFGSPDLSWNIYRDYFTPAAVEYSNGAHRYAAQAWFDATYKHIAHGGDCYGMSLRSIRTRLKDYSGTWASWWPSHTQRMVWDYLWADPQLADSIREDQSGQLSAQAAALIDDRWNHQTHNQAIGLIWQALSSGEINRMPVMCMWIGNNYGHAIVAYNAYGDGSRFAIKVYDNNKPYAETETDDHGSLAYVYPAGFGSFSYTYGDGWPAANRMIAFEYKELVYSPPLLPTAAGGTVGLASECTMVAFDSQSAVQQITDENGHTFFANGQENANQATRIADSMRFIPLTGAKWPADAPAIFIFNHSVGKSLTIDMAGNTPSAVRIFSPNTVTSLHLQQGQFKLRNIMKPEQELNLTNPNQMGMQDVQMIAVQADRSERVFQLQAFRNLGAGALTISLSPTQDTLLATGMPAQFDLAIQGLSNAGTRSAAMANLTTQAGRTTAVTVPDFRNLRNGTPKMELR